SAVNALFLDPSGLGAINDDDGMPGLFVGDAGVLTEGASATFVISLSAASGLPVSFTLQTMDFTATAGQDYAAMGRVSVTIPAGALNLSFMVPTIDDALDEPASENFLLSLSAPVNATVSDGIGQAIINDNDAAPAVYISDAAVTEGGSLVFTVSIPVISG